MLRSVLSTLLVLVASLLAEARTVTDSAERKVEVPVRIDRAHAAGPPASVLVYIMALDKLSGWPRAPRADERPYIAQAYRGLPETGRLTGRGDTVNLENLLKAQHDLIIDFGSLRDTYISLADSVQRQTGIPYLLIDGRFENTPQALRLVGDILSLKTRGERVYLSPTAPFGWIDRPPSINHIIGLRWLSGLLFPNHFTFDLHAETRRFYKLFYHVDLRDADLDSLIQQASGGP